jgi:excisionase family DNA binding protein
MTGDLLKPHEAAELLNVHPRTLIRWHAKGWVNAVTLPGGHRRFLRSEVERILATGRPG